MTPSISDLPTLDAVRDTAGWTWPDAAGSCGPIPDLSPATAPRGKTVLRCDWMPGVALDGHQVALPPDPAYAQDVYWRSVAVRRREAWLLKGDIIVEPGHRGILLDGEPLDLPKQIATDTARAVAPATPSTAPPDPGREAFVETAILFQHVWEGSFFDAFYSLHPRLCEAADLGIDPRIPLLVTRRFHGHAVTRDILNAPLAAGRPIVVQDYGQRVRCRSLYLLDPYRFYRPHWDRMSEAIAAEAPPTAIGPRIVLVRDENAKASRTTRGYDILVAALCAQGFDCVDPGALTLGQQKTVFAKARHIVTENGGALTNMMHRREGPLRIDSLIASVYRTTTFQVMAAMYGHDFTSHVLPSRRTETGIEMQLDRITCEAVLAAAGGTT
ncbi:hypothetical protein roselon_02137 [Roseibacterium elongatum DSM 19469]|uniref:Glycosyltransferase 61 catalytic domain-containing protein n=1 Tax=Roseicyclus elongatus DSM 19469 TaxID=1294273 RepID=W8S2S3_9RHOB|nr:glycosyltransferase family 61 protein [Roseibacterium elongatum]AHM04482.1 hypothetical protein roselon_02137 [Roseibacterium elongatum DSM 19469]